MEQIGQRKTYFGKRNIRTQMGGKTGKKEVCSERRMSMYVNVNMYVYIYICKLHSGQMGLFLQTLGAISSKEVAVEWWNLHRSPTILLV